MRGNRLVDRDDPLPLGRALGQPLEAAGRPQLAAFGFEVLEIEIGHARAYGRSGGDMPAVIGVRTVAGRFGGIGKSKAGVEAGLPSGTSASTPRHRQSHSYPRDVEVRRGRGFTADLRGGLSESRRRRFGR